jgi:hypothetical protein
MDQVQRDQLILLTARAVLALLERSNPQQELPHTAAPNSDTAIQGQLQALLARIPESAVG